MKALEWLVEAGRRTWTSGVTNWELQGLQYALACVILSTFLLLSHMPENVASIRLQVSG